MRIKKSQPCLALLLLSILILPPPLFSYIKVKEAEALFYFDAGNKRWEVFDVKTGEIREITAENFDVRTGRRGRAVFFLSDWYKLILDPMTGLRIQRNRASGLPAVEILAGAVTAHGAARNERQYVFKTGGLSVAQTKGLVRIEKFNKGSSALFQIRGSSSVRMSEKNREEGSLAAPIVLKEKHAAYFKADKTAVRYMPQLIEKKYTSLFSENLLRFPGLFPEDAAGEREW